MPSTTAIAMQDGYVGRIGPNAISRVAEALSAVEGAQLVDRVFRAANLERYLSNGPSQMIDEAEVARLHRAIRDALAMTGPVRSAGSRGNAPLIICFVTVSPHSAQMVIRSLPSGLASRLLTAAIARNAWTFVGTGAFAARHGRPTTRSEIAQSAGDKNPRRLAAISMRRHSSGYLPVLSTPVRARPRRTVWRWELQDCIFAITW